MIGYLKGEVIQKSPGKLLVFISGGIGYWVMVPQGVEYDLEIGQGLELFIYTHVREDLLDLYGFRTGVERELFLTLLNVSGIGPKSALNVLSAVKPNVFIEAILRKDQKILTAIPGIGKKTAERAILELTDLIQKKKEAGVFLFENVSQSGIQQHSSVYQDAKEALLALGYSEQVIDVSLRNFLNQQDSQKSWSVQDLVKLLLRSFR